MSTFVVHVETKAQEKAVKAILEALQISFEKEVDETAYITSSPAMVTRLKKGGKDIKDGK